MNLQNIKTFVAVAKFENFTKAAKELNFAQSTVTMQVQSLEKEIGILLFERIGKNIYLTDGGKEFLPEAERIIEILDRTSAIGKDYKLIKGELKIGILESLLFSKFSPILSKLKEEFPLLKISLKIGQASELFELLRLNKLDIIYVSGAQNTDEKFLCCYQRKEEIVFVAANGDKFRAADIKETTEIFQNKFIVTETNGFCFNRLKEIAENAQQTLKYDIMVDSVSAICDLIKATDCIAYLPKYAIQNRINTGELIEIQHNGERSVYYSQLLCQKEKWLSPFIKRLIATVEKMYPPQLDTNFTNM